jgi:hypothetical protein
MFTLWCNMKFCTRDFMWLFMHLSWVVEEPFLSILHNKYAFALFYCFILFIFDIVHSFLSKKLGL